MIGLFPHLNKTKQFVRYKYVFDFFLNGKYLVKFCLCCPNVRRYNMKTDEFENKWLLSL